MKPELLAPAGDYEKLKWAIWYGADAVYIGGPLFGLRANAGNFSLSEIKKATSFAHRHQKKVYVTINIAFHHQEINKITAYLKKLDEIKVDAIIVSDFYILKLAKKITKLAVFISTQASVMNYQAAKYYEKNGADRIILARELHKDDILKIKEETNIELETFLHGAMCSAVSGRCVLSNYLTNRDANRGGCSQVCRWNFELSEKNQAITPSFAIAVKDLIMVDHLAELMQMDSLKIEGRMRSIYYIATVVSIYRRLIDGLEENPNYKLSKQDYQRLYQTANRELIPQFFQTGDCKEYQYYNNHVESSNQDFLGVVLKNEKNLILVEQRNYFTTNQIVEIFGPKELPKQYQIKAIYDEDMQKIAVVRHPRQKVYLDVGELISKNGLIRKII